MPVNGTTVLMFRLPRMREIKSTRVNQGNPLAVYSDKEENLGKARN